MLYGSAGADGKVAVTGLTLKSYPVVVGWHEALFWESASLAPVRRMEQAKQAIAQFFHGLRNPRREGEEPKSTPKDGMRSLFCSVTLLVYHVAHIWCAGMNSNHIGFRAAPAVWCT